MEARVGQPRRVDDACRGGALTRARFAPPRAVARCGCIGHCRAGARARARRCCRAQNNSTRRSTFDPAPRSKTHVRSERIRYSRKLTVFSPGCARAPHTSAQVEDGCILMPSVPCTLLSSLQLHPEDEEAPPHLAHDAAGHAVSSSARMRGTYDSSDGTLRPTTLAASSHVRILSNVVCSGSASNAAACGGRGAEKKGCSDVCSGALHSGVCAPTRACAPRPAPAAHLGVGHRPALVHERRGGRRAQLRVVRLQRGPTRGERSACACTVSECAHTGPSIGIGTARWRGIHERARTGAHGTPMRRGPQHGQPPTRSPSIPATRRTAFFQHR